MKRIIKVIFVLLIIFLVAGCATSGPKYSELSPTISSLSPDKGRIYVYRTSALGAAIQPDVKLNGEVIGSSTPNGFFYIDRAAGNYEITTATEVERKLSFTLDPGQSRYIRLNVSMGFFVGHVYPELIENEVAQKEIQNCRYTAKAQ